MVSEVSHTDAPKGLETVEATEFPLNPKIKDTTPKQKKIMDIKNEVILFLFITDPP